jgi:hypothetical protein
MYQLSFSTQTAAAASRKTASHFVAAPAFSLAGILALLCVMWLINLAEGKAPANSLDARSELGPVEVTFSAPELRDANAMSLRSWFFCFGDNFPLNLEFVTSPFTGGFGGTKSPPKWRGLIVPAGKITLPQIIALSTEKLRAVLHDDSNGKTLTFHVDPKVANPFDRKLSKAIEGTFTFEKAFTKLGDASHTDLYPFSRLPLPDIGLREIDVSIPAGSTLRAALNTMTAACGCHWSALVTGAVEGSDLFGAVDSGQEAFVWIQFYWATPK